MTNREQVLDVCGARRTGGMGCRGCKYDLGRRPDDGSVGLCLSEVGPPSPVKAVVDAAARPHPAYLERDGELEVERLRQRRAYAEAAFRAGVTDVILDIGASYSGELRRLVPSELSFAVQTSILNQMEREGALVSHLVNPPHDGRRGGGIQRRYYRLAAR